MIHGDPSTDFERVQLERDLYLGLLNLSNREDPGAFLEEALGLIVRVFGVDQGYLELSDPQEGPTWWRAAGCLGRGHHFCLGLSRSYVP